MNPFSYGNVVKFTYQNIIHRVYIYYDGVNHIRMCAYIYQSLSSAITNEGMVKRTNIVIKYREWNILT